MRKKTVQAMIDACHSAKLYFEKKSDESVQTVCAKLDLALSLVDEDKTRTAQETRRRITKKAQQALDYLRTKEWSTAQDLEVATETHRFSDAIYNLSQNGYTVIHRYNRTEKQREYKLVRGPGWLGWNQGEPILPTGKRKKRKRDEIR